MSMTSEAPVVDVQAPYSLTPIKMNGPAPGNAMPTALIPSPCSPISQTICGIVYPICGPPSSSVFPLAERFPLTGTALLPNFVGIHTDSNNSSRAA